MTVLDNLKRLADAVVNSPPEDKPWLTFHEATSPEAILALIAEIEQRERKVERLIAAGNQLAREYEKETGDCPPVWRRAVADLQADSPPPIARDPIPDTGGKIKW